MSDPNSIDYIPLVAMEHAWGKAAKQALRGYRAVVCIFLVALSAVLLRYGAYQVAFLVGIGYFFYIGVAVRKVKNGVWTAFAAANSWSVQPTTEVPASISYGHSPILSPVINAQLGEVPADLYAYQCTTGNGKSQQTHIFTVARVTLPKALPHLLLLRKKAYAEVRQDLIAGEKLPLEGDFDQYFTLMVEKGQEVDALTVLTPDVMQLLITYDSDEDIELVGTNVYFIVRSDKRGVSDMQQLIRSVVELSTRIISHIEATERPAPMAAETPAPAPQVLTVAG